MSRRNNHPMSEGEWRLCTDPERMLDAVRGIVGHRKLRLFACHCCRKVAHLLDDSCEDGGCADSALLTHCREPGEHLRGCWVVDLLLGKK
jgi:hypothetical protein